MVAGCHASYVPRATAIHARMVRGKAVLSAAEAATLPHSAVDPVIAECRYDHLQFFVDELQPLAHYKAIEDRLNSFAQLVPRVEGSRLDVDAARNIWREVGGTADPGAFQVHGRDLVEQLLHGFGWRVTGAHSGAETRSLLLSTPDASGARFVITTRNQGGGSGDDGSQAGGPPSSVAATDSHVPSESYDHFAASHLERYASSHRGAQGVAVLGFELSAGDLAVVLQRYTERHPKLVVGPPHTHADGTTILDVYAYYEAEVGESEADPGTVLRFVERPQARGRTGTQGEKEAICEERDAASMPLPGLQPLEARFEPSVLPAYCDHWVSNVRSRVGFLQTMEETLGFVPKVDFNAGVVAAGEAQIESTVMGNASPLVTADPKLALADRGQVFLPTNNALSPVGHVYWYLEELGQGVQHVASRVSSLPEYVQRANDMRSITGEGFTFLNIPRTYYGLLSKELLINGGVDGELLGADTAGLSEADADAVLVALREASLLDQAGAFSLEADTATIGAALASVGCYHGANEATRSYIQSVLRRSCYVNLWKLMRDQLSEPTYLSIVRNKILLDVQGGDVLMQIFTSVVLQREPNTEAPFLEFIQRVCAQCDDGTEACEPIRPGCGGFGIRNFLTLFLSIEVSKAMFDANAAEESGDGAAAAFHRKRVQLFTEQLVESNPILNAISDCMTAEGKAVDAGDRSEADAWAQRKEEANLALQECSQKYNTLMKDMREVEMGQQGCA